ncbi:MAG: GspE/PulE family protein, partial [Burkholderiaceae bacterium]
MAAVLPSSAPNASMSGLARALLQAGRLTAQQAETISKQSIAAKTPFIDNLLQSGSIDARSLAIFCSETFGYPMMDFSSFNLATRPENIIDAKLMSAQRVVALAKRGNKVSVAISDPTNTQALDQIKFQTELTVDPVIVDHTSLLQLVEKLGQSAEQNLNELIGDDLEIDFSEVDTATTSPDAAAADIDDAPVVKFLQKILIDAINMGASDLHFEPFEKFYRIRFRVDGVLKEVAQPPLAIK